MIKLINKMTEKTRPKFTFIDLFAGIGGFHLALHDLGGECVFASEWDRYARKTYEHNFKKTASRLFETGNFAGDITKVDANSIPDFDILTGGFPCQPFSQAGKGRGFDDDRGTLFGEIIRIAVARRPKVIFLENVRNIITHDENRTFASILEKLDKAGYYVNKERDDSWNIFNASEFGLPTRRSRFYLVALRKDSPNAGKFIFPKPTTPKGMTLRKFFKDEKWPDMVGRTIRVGGRGSPVYLKPDGEWFVDRRSWDTYIIENEKHVLTLDEAKKMMGFKKGFHFPDEVTPNQAFKQLGNSVAVNVIREIGKKIVEFL